MLRTLYKDDDRFVETYWDKFGRDVYFVGDAARKDEDGYFWVIGRVDDVINVSGHRLSTAEVESRDRLPREGRRGGRDRPAGRGHRPVDHRVRDALGQPGGRRRRWSPSIREHVAKRIGKLARPKRIIWADDLPKTRSGKIMRRLLRDIAEGTRARRRHDAARPGRDAAARGQGQGAPERGGVTIAMALARAPTRRRSPSTSGTSPSATTSPPTCCDKHPADKLAMIHEDFEGNVREVRWGELQEKSNRLRQRAARARGGARRPRGDAAAADARRRRRRSSAPTAAARSCSRCRCSTATTASATGVSDSQAKVLVTNAANKDRVDRRWSSTC